MSYRFITDPGHGWLEVPCADLVVLGVARDISRYSYLDHTTGMAYLEEDCDAPKFLQAFTAHFGRKPDFLEVYEEETAVRNLPDYTMRSALTLALRFPLRGSAADGE